MVTYDKILEIRKLLWEGIYKHYISEELFSGPWLFLLGLTLISYIVWIKVLDKSRIIDLLLVGSLVAVAMSFLDVVATTMVLWSHKIRVFPGVPSLFATDYTLYPIMVMIVFQFCNSWKKYLFWSIISASILAFVFFPLYIVVGTMALNRLNYFHVFLVAYITAVVARAVFIWVTKIKESQKNRGNQ
jgi:hypothetical protein